MAADFFLSKTAVFAVFEERVQDGRAGRGEAVEVIEQDDASTGRGDQAGAVFASVGKGASLVAEEDAAEQRFVGQLVAGGNSQRGIAAFGGVMEQGRQPALAGAALAVEHEAGQGAAESARDARGLRGFLAQKPGEAEDLGQRGAEGVGLVDEALIGDGLGEGPDGRFGEVTLEGGDDDLGQRGFAGAAGAALPEETVLGEPLGPGIGGVEQAHGLGMDAGQLLDEEVAGSLAPGVVGEAEVGDDDGEKLLVQELAREVEPASSLANEVQVDVVRGAMAIGGETFALEPVGADLDAHGSGRARGIPFTPMQKVRNGGVPGQAPGQLAGEAGEERVENARVVVEDHHVGNPGHGSLLQRTPRCP